MEGLKRIKSLHEFIEKDKDQGVERTYYYHSTDSKHIHTDKQEIDIIETRAWGKMLFLDKVLQSTTRDEVIYHNALVHPLMEFLPKDQRKNVLILGGGEGATAREVLRWNVDAVTMVDYDAKLVEYMINDDSWAKGAFNDERLSCVIEDAWTYMKTAPNFNAIIIDLFDPDFKKEAIKWLTLLKLVMASIAPLKGGFVINAGLYVPWNVSKIREVCYYIEQFCVKNPGYKYHVYTAMIPSFNGDWTFITVTHCKKKFMREPESLECIPLWIRQGIRSLAHLVITMPDDECSLNNFKQLE